MMTLEPFIWPRKDLLQLKTSWSTKLLRASIHEKAELFRYYPTCTPITSGFYNLRWLFSLHFGTLYQLESENNKFILSSAIYIWRHWKDICILLLIWLTIKILMEREIWRPSLRRLFTSSSCKSGFALAKWSHFLRNAFVSPSNKGIELWGLYGPF